MYEIETLALHAGEEADPQTGALRLPIQMATTFKLPGFGRKLFDALLMESDRPPHAYTRWSNPTIRALEERMAALEGGSAALATATGMAAVYSTFAALLKTGDHVISSKSIFGSSHHVIENLLPNWDIDFTFVDIHDKAGWEKAFRPETKLVFVETPANPTLDLIEIEWLASLCHDHGSLLIVDNCFATPYLQQPLKHLITF